MPVISRLRRAFLAAALALVAPTFVVLPAAAQENGLVTRQSAHSVPETIKRFDAAVREAGWAVFTMIDHAAAATSAGLSLKPRTVVVFGNPRAGTPQMAARPTLALDLPMRVLVWEDDQGRVFVTRSTGEDVATRVFARHGITQPPEARAGTEALFARLVAKAVE
jgi:uncharacterized protein (DUF302 family)